ncbi:MAG: BatA domain-containing protein [Planctomycetota bacterium]
MSFASPLGLLALLGIPVVLYLHLFRRRLQEVPVAGLFLWGASAERAAEGRRRTRLLSHPSLWLELLGVVLLSLLLAGARIGVGGERVHLVAVLDGTASMGAVAGDRSQSAAERARSVLEDRIADLPRDAEVTILVSGVRPELLAGPRVARDLAPAALDRYAPTATGHGLDTSLELARELGGSDAQYLLLTDRPLLQDAPGFSIEAFGVAAQNVAVRDARRIRRVDGGESVLADVVVFGRSTSAVLRVEPAAGGAALGELAVELEPGRARRLRIDIPEVDGALRVRATSEGDGLRLDDEAVLPVPALRVVSLGSDLPPEVQIGLGLVRLVEAIPGLRFVTEGEVPTLRVGAAPSALEPGHHELVVGPRPIGVPVEDLEAWLGPFLIDRRQEPARGLTLEGVVWSAGGGGLPGAPFVLAEDRVLASSEEVGASLRVHLDLAPARSNLVVSPDWPVLFANLVDMVRSRLPGLVDRVVPVGGTIQFRGDNARDSLRLVAEDGETWPGRGDGLVTFAAVRPGLHRLMQEGRVLDEVGVHFVDPTESDLTGRATFSRPAETAPAAVPASASSQPSGRAESRLLALLRVVMVAAHAASLARRTREVAA